MAGHLQLHRFLPVLVAASCPMVRGAVASAEAAGIGRLVSFAERAAWTPAFAPSLLPRPRGGFHEWTFNFYGASGGPGFDKFVAAMKHFGVGNGFDPFGTDRAGIIAASKLGWPVLMNPVHGGNTFFDVPGGPNNMTAEELQRLQILEDANVYSQIQFGEWGGWFSGLRPAKCGDPKQPHECGNAEWWHINFPNTLNTTTGQMTNDTDFQYYWGKYATPVADSQGTPLVGFEKMPASRKEAYEIYRAYYNNRIAWLSSVGDQPYQRPTHIGSITCGFHGEIYAALWNMEGPNNAVTSNAGLELQCQHANVQFAMARGGARRSGKVWTVQPSGWGYGHSVTGCGPMQCKTGGQTYNRPCTPEESQKGARCSGSEAGHSYSWYWRIWFHSWFAGAASVTAEGASDSLFACDGSLSSLERHGLQAQSVLGMARQRDRGTAVTPLAVMIDKYLGYGVPHGKFQPGSWGVFNLSLNDYQFHDLLHQQLFPPADLLNDEPQDLKTTPHGEIADIILADAPPDFLSLYPVLLLAGDQDFSGDLVERLHHALNSTADELILQQYHVDAMGAVDFAMLKKTGKVSVVAPAPLPATGRTPALSDAHLDTIAHKYLPVVVANATMVGDGKAVSILWQVNSQKEGGFVIELSSEWGVEKPECGTMKLDPAGAVRVTLLLRKAAWGAKEWVHSAMVHNGPLAVGAMLDVVVPPGNSSFIAFGAERAREQETIV